MEGMYSDAAGAMKYLQETRRTERDEIVVFGRSLGGAVAAWTAERFSPAGLVLESTFTSLADVGRRYYFFLPVGLIVGDAFDTLGRMKGISCPVLVASSPGDEIVPGSHGEAQFQAAGEPKSFLPLVGDHNSCFLLTGQAYVDGLRNFFRSVLPGFGPKE